MKSAKDLRARFAEQHCKREGHTHAPAEAAVCAEILLARKPGSTGIKVGLFPRTPPSLQAFYERYCVRLHHAHDERSAVLCIDLMYRQSIQTLGRRLAQEQARTAKNQRPPGSVF